MRARALRHLLQSLRAAPAKPRRCPRPMSRVASAGIVLGPFLVASSCADRHGPSPAEGPGAAGDRQASPAIPERVASAPVPTDASLAPPLPPSGANRAEPVGG